MNQYLFGLVIIELCECGAMCHRPFDPEWDCDDDIVHPACLDECPRCSELEWPQVDKVRFYKP